MDINILKKRVIDAIKMASISVPQDVEYHLQRAYEKEDTSIAKSQLSAILENIKLARMQKRPLCQDTGLLGFYITVGYEFPYTTTVLQTLEQCVIEATDTIPLRPNTTCPFTGRNPGNNTGPFMPLIDVISVPGGEMDINILPKGGGSENASALWMLTPSEAIETIQGRIIEHIARVGGKACPPLILGIGIGGTADYATRLAKRALLRRIGERHPESYVAKMESELLEKINSLGIGPMGLGGKTTALDVHIEYTYRHPATYPVALAVQCWADRRCTIQISQRGKITLIQ